MLIVPVYGQHLKQILVTIGGSIVAEQLLYALFGPDEMPLAPPATFRGSFVLGDAAIEKYRVVAIRRRPRRLSSGRRWCSTAPGSGC